MVVVDNNGVPICLSKMDGGNYHSYEQGIRKARTAAMWAMDTSEYHKLIQRRDWSEQTYGPDYTVCYGGVTIILPEYEESRANVGVCRGGIGVSYAGEHQVDDAVARVGLEYIKSVLWPSK